MFPYANKDKELPTAAKKGETEVFLAELEHLRALANQTKKFIYRAGRTPDWVVGDGDDSEGEEDQRPQRSERERERKTSDRPPIRGTMKIKLEKEQSETLGRRIHRAQVVSRSDEKETPVTGNKRSRPVEVEDEDEQEIKREREPKQTKHEPFSLTTSTTLPSASHTQPMEITPTFDTAKLVVQEDEEQDEDDLESRRDRARERAKQQVLKEEKDKEVKKEPEMELEEGEEPPEGEQHQKKMHDGLGEGAGVEGLLEGEEEDVSEESEEEAGDMITSRPLLKPVFVSKKERETIAERKRLEEEEKALEKAKK